MAKDIWSEKPSQHASHGDTPKFRIWPWALGVAILLLAFFVVMPAIKGFSVYRAMTSAGVPDTYVADMQGLSRQLGDTQVELNRTVAALGACTADLASCGEQRTALEGEKATIQASFDTCSADLGACGEAKATLDAVVADAARRICCVQRVENPAISGFTVLDDKISCVTDGGQAISC